MGNENYVRLNLAGWHLDSKPRYEVGEREVADFNNPVRVRWPDGQVTSEEVAKRHVKYVSVRGGKILCYSCDLPTILVDKNGTKVVLESMDGLDVNIEDVRFR